MISIYANNAFRSIGDISSLGNVTELSFHLPLQRFPSEEKSTVTDFTLGTARASILCERFDDSNSGASIRFPRQTDALACAPTGVRDATAAEYAALRPRRSARRTGVKRHRASAGGEKTCLSSYAKFRLASRNTRNSVGRSDARARTRNLGAGGRIWRFARK